MNIPPSAPTALGTKKPRMTGLISRLGGPEKGVKAGPGDFTEKNGEGSLSR